MSQTNDPKRDELEERLMDQALREVLGGEAPPDLSDKILAAAQNPVPVSLQLKEPVMERSKRRFSNTVVATLAACLLVGATVALLLPSMQSARYAANRSELSTTASPTDERAPEPVGQTQTELIRSPALEMERKDRQSELWRGIAAAPPEIQTSEKGQVAASLEKTVPEASALQVQLGEEMSRTIGTWDRLLLPNSLGEIVDEPLPGNSSRGDKYDRLADNSVRTVKDHPLSTFSIDVDTASYANVRRFLLQEGRLPPADAVRIEELINYFDYGYAGPKDDVPFAAHIAATGCPWKAGHRLVRIGIKGKELSSEDRPESNLVFLLDVSGSMATPDKLPLVKDGMKLLAEQMRENDRVAIVVYASSEGLVLPSTPGAQREKILAALDRLQAGGSTNGGAGIELAYRLARENFVPGGVNRVLLCTDGDFNVGTTGTDDLVRMVEENARTGVFLSVLGFGRGNLNDAMMESISNKGNGNYAYIDSITEARKVLVEQMGGTLTTIAKDVKIQVEFNPSRVAAYRLIGYENRMLAAEDFNDDKKDAGEIGAGHTVTALYEIVPAGAEIDAPAVDPLKYQPAGLPKDDHQVTDELLTLKLRYKEPAADTSKRLEIPLVDQGGSFGQASADVQFAAAVAAFGMLLRDSEHKGTATYDAVLEIAASAKGSDLRGYRAEFVEMVRRAKMFAER